MSKPIKLSYLPLLLLAAACGRGFERPAVTEDPLGACEQLSRTTCGQRSDCTVEPLVCPAICRDDGFGGCLPCDAFRCIPTPPPPACEALTVAQCGARSDCELEQVACLAICQPDGNGGCAPCPQQQRCVTKPPPACSSLDLTTCATRPDCRIEGDAVSDPGFGAPCAPDSDGCRRPARCVDAPPPACEQLSVAQCGARPDCHVEDAVCDCVNCGCDVPRCLSGPAPCSALDVNTCATRRDCRIVFPGSGFSDCDGPNCQRPLPEPVDGGSGAPPAPPAICVDAGPIACWELDITTCASRPGCELREVTACPACTPGAPCPPCETTLLCDVAQTPDVCSGLDPAVCEANPGCMLEELTACPACAPGSTCPPCETQRVCVARPPVDSCSGLDVAACSARSDCQVEEVGVCPACAPGSPCPPCTTTFVCVSRPPVDKCSVLDVATCRVTPECEVQSVGVCPACTPGGNCPPCTTTEICVSAPSRCYRLDEQSCSADPSCRLETWACPAVCIDDGMGGCLPCQVPPPSCVPNDPTPVPGPVPLDGGVAPPRGP